MKRILVVLMLVPSLLTGQVGSSDQQFTAGQWIILHKVDPITDARLTAAYHVSTDGKALLAINCWVGDADTTEMELVVGWPNYFAEAEGNHVALRVDREPAVYTDWAPTNGHTALRYVGYLGDVKWLMNSLLLPHRQLLVAIVGSEYYNRSATFNLMGLAAAVGPLRRACGF